MRPFFTSHAVREAAKKVLLLMAGPLRGGGGKGQGHLGKKSFLERFFKRSNVPTAIKLEGGGVKP